MKKSLDFIVTSTIKLCCLLAFIPLSSGQSVTINPVQGCFAPGIPITLTGQGSTGTSNYLRCFEWTSSNPAEVINNDWMLSVTVTPQVPTDYILSVTEAGVSIASDTVQVSIDGLNNFDLPCVVDVKDGPVNVAGIANHQGGCCIAGYTYTPAQLDLPINVPKQTIQVTAQCGNTTLTKDVHVINSNVTITGLELSATPEGVFSISGTKEGIAFESTYDFSAVNGMITNIDKALNKLPLPPPIDIDVPTFAGSGSITTTYMKCQAPNCVKKKVTTGGEISIFLGKIEAGIIYGTPLLAAQANLLLTGNLAVGINGANNCMGGEICRSVGLDFTAEGTVSIIGGAGLIKGDLFLVWGVDSEGQLCLLIPQYTLEPSFRIGTKDLEIGGRVVLGWGFASKEVRYTVMKGNPNLITL